MKLYIVLPVKMLKRKNKLWLLLLAVLFSTALQAQDSTNALLMNYNYINSVPQNAAVYVNGSLAGYTPLYLMWSDSTRANEVSIMLEGFAAEKFTVDAGDKVNRSVSLNPTGKTKLLSQVKEGKSTYFAKPRKVVPIVLSSLVALGSGAAAFYYKKLASDNREKFELDGDQDALDKKGKYDVLSGVSLVVFQIGFGALMYYLFLD